MEVTIEPRSKLTLTLPVGRVKYSIVRQDPPRGVDGQVHVGYLGKTVRARFP